MKVIYDPDSTSFISALDTMYPTASRMHTENVKNDGMSYSATYGYCINGSAVVVDDNGEWNVSAGRYFVFSGQISIKKATDLQMWTVMKVGFKPMTQVGAVESKGRLSYIDGCSDSVLVSMPRYGDPVLNYLHFPTGIYQTQHTHPSIRMGLVIKGSGEAFMEKSNNSEGWVKPLQTGCMFMLEEQELHSFCEMGLQFE